HHSLPADINGICSGQEMHRFDDAIGFQHNQPVACRWSNNCTVITRPRNFVLASRQSRQDPGEQTVFAESLQFHCETISGNASSVSEAALNNACIVIETRIEPLHS